MCKTLKEGDGIGLSSRLSAVSAVLPDWWGFEEYDLTALKTFGIETIAQSDVPIGSWAGAFYPMVMSTSGGFKIWRRVHWGQLAADYLSVAESGFAISYGLGLRAHPGRAFKSAWGARLTWSIDDSRVLVSYYSVSMPMKLWPPCL